ncbi:MAG: hypothetical protein GY859_42635, partial [Desulfobacterales bacterium]|nr:hypothetical protein [Desulfobacterales bacterium]
MACHRGDPGDVAERFYGALERFPCNAFVRIRGDSPEKQPDLKLTARADEILDDPDVDVVSIASFDNYNYEHGQFSRTLGENPSM